MSDLDMIIFAICFIFFFAVVYGFYLRDAIRRYRAEEFDRRVAEGVIRIANNKERKHGSGKVG